jgi:hypothetical protein
MRKSRLAWLLAILLASALAYPAFRSIFAPHQESRPSNSSAYFDGGPHGRDDEDDLPADPVEREVTGGVRGNVVDESNQPVYAIEVDLISADKMRAGEDERWRATHREWTGKNGDYEFSHLSPGEYFLSVGSDAAPTGKHPFAPSHYPGADRQVFSEPIRVQPSVLIELRVLRLRRLPTTSIKVHVNWLDGTPVEWSNLLFHNPSFPNQGVIGNEGLGIKDGEGEVVLPVGFDYYARAAVQCDGGAQIRSEESRPVQKIRVDASHVPTELTFVMPTGPCKLWRPRAS